MSTLEFINRIIQVLCIRLTKINVVKSMDLQSVSIMSHGNVSLGFKPKQVEYYWAIMYWVVPFTGWNSQYKFLFKQTTCKYTEKIWPLPTLDVMCVILKIMFICEICFILWGINAVSNANKHNIFRDDKVRLKYKQLIIDSVNNSYFNPIYDNGDIGTANRTEEDSK